MGTGEVIFANDDIAMEFLNTWNEAIPKGICPEDLKKENQRDQACTGYVIDHLKHRYKNFTGKFHIIIILFQNDFDVCNNNVCVVV